MTITLIGMSGAGKSKVGKELSKLTGLEFVDGDERIAAHENESHQEVLARLGTEGFLRIEDDVLVELAALENIVIATGGSAVLSPDAMDVLARRTHVVYLHAALPALVARVGSGEGRGIVGLGEKSFSEIYAERLPLYKKYAAVTVRTGKRSATAVAQDILAQLT